LLVVHSVAAAPFTSHTPNFAITLMSQDKKKVPELNRHILTFLHPILLCRITFGAPLEML
jgi:hypothetical protein